MEKQDHKYLQQKKVILDVAPETASRSLFIFYHLFVLYRPFAERASKIKTKAIVFSLHISFLGLFWLIFEAKSVLFLKGNSKTAL